MLERSPLTPVFSFTHFYSRMFVNITSLNLFSYAMLDSPHYNSACLYSSGKRRKKQVYMKIFCKLSFWSGRIMDLMTGWTIAVYKVSPGLELISLLALRPKYSSPPFFLFSEYYVALGLFYVYILYGGMSRPTCRSTEWFVASLLFFLGGSCLCGLRRDSRFEAYKVWIYFSSSSSSHFFNPIKKRKKKRER